VLLDSASPTAVGIDPIINGVAKGMKLCPESTNGPEIPAVDNPRAAGAKNSLDLTLCGEGVEGVNKQPMSPEGRMVTREGFRSPHLHARFPKDAHLFKNSSPMRSTSNGSECEALFHHSLNMDAAGEIPWTRGGGRRVRLSELVIAPDNNFLRLLAAPCESTIDSELV